MRLAEGFIAVDWGTTNRRAYRIDGDGRCGDEFEDERGVLSVAEGDFPARWRRSARGSATCRCCWPG